MSDDGGAHGGGFDGVTALADDDAGQVDPGQPPDITPSAPDLSQPDGLPEQVAPTWNPTVECAAAALRDVIAWAEGTANKPNGGYGTVALGTVTNGGADYNDLVGQRNVQLDPSDYAGNGHPGILVQVTPGLKSTAFGRYQINVDTANEIGAVDMAPFFQDADANLLMAKKGMINLAVQGDPEAAIQAGNRRWVSLPGAQAGQPTKTMDDAMAVYDQATYTEPECLNQGGG